MSLEINRKKIDEILQLLKDGNWQIPEFQRDYVWTQDQVKKLISSIIKSYPTGLITTWDQPQNNPHTPGEPLKLKGASYGEFEKDPAVIKLVLDGKQRLTTLAMVFGGFKSKNGNYSFSGEWFIDLEAYVNDDDLKVVLYKRQSEISSQDLNVITSCVRKGIIPFKHFSRLSEYIAKIHDPATYPAEAYPDQKTREERISALTRLQKTYESFLIPYAEIPNNISLGDVCEIFDVLNTTGTKVSTFDLLHNILFKDSTGAFNLREKFGECAELQSIGLLCDEGRQEFFCQIVTGCFTTTNAQGRSIKHKVTSIKGPDLINTPLAFYSQLTTNLSLLNDFAKDFFANVFDCEVKLSDLPYPASSVIYFALRWKMSQGPVSYTLAELNSVYRAFYWRNVLTNRYDQGFLTQFSTDLRELDRILEVNHGTHDTPAWISSVSEELNALFGNDYQVKLDSDILETLLTEETRGALRQLYLICLKSRTKFDIVDNSTLDWFTSTKQDKVQIHHIFPRDWCKNNKISEDEELEINCVANLIPLKAQTNNTWKANSPATAIINNQISYEDRVTAFQGAFIDKSSFDLLKANSVEEFWHRRADTLASHIFNMQLIR